MVIRRRNGCALSNHSPASGSSALNKELTVPTETHRIRFMYSKTGTNKVTWHLMDPFGANVSQLSKRHSESEKYS